MKFKTIKLIILIIISGTIVYLLFNKITGQKTTGLEIQTSTTQTPFASVTIPPSPTQIPTDGLKNIIEPVLKETKDSYGIVVKNLQTGEAYYLNEHREYETGSLYKLWVMATVFDFIRQNKLKGSDILSYNVKTLNDSFNISSEAAELKNGTITFSVDDALKEMITVSHNYAALLLSKRVGLSSVADFLRDYGFSESKVGLTGGTPTSTPYDIALFFEKLYKGELINKEYNGDMLDLLKRQQLNGKIPKDLPSDITIAHKTGEMGMFTHDAGTVFSDKGDYIIVVMAESEIPSDAEEHISNISKAVYEYFEKG